MWDINGAEMGKSRKRGGPVSGDEVSLPRVNAGANKEVEHVFSNMPRGTLFLKAGGCRLVSFTQLPFQQMSLDFSPALFSVNQAGV